MNITDIQKKDIEALGDSPVQMAMKIHRDKLEKTSNEALDSIKQDLPHATTGEKVKIYDVTRKHLNIIDGIHNDSGQNNNIIIIPGELVMDVTQEVNEQLQTKKTKISLKTLRQSNSIHAKVKSPKTSTGLESLIVEGVSEKLS